MFYTEEQIAKLYPDAYELVCKENSDQYPNAKFVTAADGRYAGNCKDTIEVMFLYDVGNSDVYLWAYLPGMLSEEYKNNRFYIDKYYEVSIEEAIKNLTNIQEK